MRNSTLIAAIAVLLLLSTDAAAHKFAIERTAMIQVKSARAEVMIVLSEPPGERTDRILARFDRDKNGRIEGLEGKLAKPSMVKRVLLGVDVSFPDIEDAPKPTTKIKFQRNKNGGIDSAVYLDYKLMPNKEQSVKFGIANKKGIVATRTMIVAGEGMKLESLKPEIDRLLIAGDGVVFEPGDHVTASFQSAR